MILAMLSLGFCDGMAGFCFWRPCPHIILFIFLYSGVIDRKAPAVGKDDCSFLFTYRSLYWSKDMTLGQKKWN